MQRCSPSLYRRRGTRKRNQFSPTGEAKTVCLRGGHCDRRGEVTTSHQYYSIIRYLYSSIYTLVRLSPKQPQASVTAVSGPARDRVAKQTVARPSPPAPS